MKAIALPIKELRLLSLQLQNFQGGFTVEQIRLLDKAITCMDEVVKGFDAKVMKMTDEIKAVLEAKKDPKEENDKLESFMNKEGNKVVECALEDSDYEFVKAIWNKMAGFSGAGIARKSIITVDDAIKAAGVKVFAN